MDYARTLATISPRMTWWLGVAVLGVVLGCGRGTGDKQAVHGAGAGGTVPTAGMAIGVVAGVSGGPPEQPVRPTARAGTSGMSSAGAGASVAGSAAGSGSVQGAAGSMVVAGRAAPNAGAHAAGGSVATSAPGSAAPGFILGADISSVHERAYKFVDTDGETKSVFELLKRHGFNYIRVKTFVEPNAPHGYASTTSGCAGLPEPFSDRDHVVAFGRQIKQAGMGFLLDFHYSDTWADPGKQHIPAAWRGAKSIAELAGQVKAYTRDVLMTAAAQGALPDMVQIGNEITPGMLMHIPGSRTDCWGNNPESAPIGGSTSNWDNLASLLQAGIEATREVDPKIRIVLHLESTDDLSATRWWIDNAMQRKLDFDVLGLSCYTAFQGEPSVWEATFSALASAYPRLTFLIAEYNPERMRANLIMHRLPERRGLGTFLWEPTRSGAWGSALFTAQGDTLRANTADFEVFDQLLPMLER